MNREIYTVTATQIVTSSLHPEGLKTNVSGYPVDFDSRDYEATEANPNGNGEIALIAGRAEFWKAVKTLRTANNQSRVMWTVKLEQANGREIDRQTFGAFPDITPAQEPTPNTEPEEAEGE